MSTVIYYSVMSVSSISVAVIISALMDCNIDSFRILVMAMMSSVVDYRDVVTVSVIGMSRGSVCYGDVLRLLLSNIGYVTVIVGTDISSDVVMGIRDYVTVVCAWITALLLLNYCVI